MGAESALRLFLNWGVYNSESSCLMSKGPGRGCK